MRHTALALMVVWVASTGAASAAGAGGDPAAAGEHRERIAELRSLKPRPGPADIQLADAAAVVELGADLDFLLGADARRFMRLTQGVDYPRVEAVVIGGRRGFVFVEWFDSGYVPTGDWHRLDPARLMDRIKRATAEANARRRAAGVGGIEVVGWAEPPRRIGRRGGDGVRWAIEAIEGEPRAATINAVALKLGRGGYHKLTWVGSGAAYGALSAAGAHLLDRVVAGHRFLPGHGHDDYAAGDRRAPFGLVALVTTAATTGPGPRHGGAGDVVAAMVAAAFPEAAWPALALLAAPWAVARLAARRRRRRLGA